MPYVTSQNAPKQSAPAGRSSLLIIAMAVVILLVIIGAYAYNYSKGKAEETRMARAMDPQKRIEEIQNNPRMPAQAKAAAIEMIQRSQARGGGAPKP